MSLINFLTRRQTSGMKYMESKMEKCSFINGRKKMYLKMERLKGLQERRFHMHDKH